MTDFVLTPAEAMAKQLLRLGVHKAGGAKAASEWTGLDESEISRLGSDDIDRHVHLSRMIELDEASDHAILKAWARRYGFEVIVNEAAQANRQSVAKAAGDGIEASASYFRKVFEAGEDGVATNNELREVEKRKNKVIAGIEESFDALQSLRVVKAV